MHMLIANIAWLIIENKRKITLINWERTGRIGLISLYILLMNKLFYPVGCRPGLLQMTLMHNFPIIVGLLE